MARARFQSIRKRRSCRQRRDRVTRVLQDITVTPDFSGLPPSLYHGLVQLTNNAAALLTLVAGLGLVVSLIGLVLVSVTANRDLGPRSTGRIAVSAVSIS